MGVISSLVLPAECQCQKDASFLNLYTSFPPHYTWLLKFSRFLEMFANVAFQADTKIRAVFWSFSEPHWQIETSK